MTDKKYTAVVVGCGAIGVLLEVDPKRPKPATHAGALSAHPRTRLVALVDSNKKNLAAAGKLFPKATRYENLAECLESEKPDIVSIATGASSHRAIIETCARFGVKTIICEKPLAETPADAKVIELLVKQKKMMLVLNYQRRFFALFERARKEIAAGKLGEIQQVTCYYSNGLYNNGGHVIDALHYILEDRFVAVSAWSNMHNRTHPKGDANIDALMSAKKGAVVTLQSVDQTKWGANEIHIYGEKGAIVLGEYGYAYTFIPAKPSVFGGVLQLDSAKSKTLHKKESMVAGAVARAVECLEGRAKMHSSTAEGREVLAVCEALSKSAKAEGKKVSVHYA